MRVASGPLPIRWDRSGKIFILLLVVGSLLLSSCGFHLRGSGNFALPASFSTLKVTREGNQALNDPLLLAMKNALNTQSGVTVVDTGDTPILILSDERSDSQVLSVGATGKVDEYLLTYEVSFRLLGADGAELTEIQTVKLQRDHSFDRLNVLAKEREEADLRREMQRDAVQQILRRLARISLSEINPIQSR